MRTLTGYIKEVTSLAVLQNGDLASGTNQQISIWNSSTGSLKRNLTGDTNWIYALAVLKNGDLASGSGDATIKIWDSSTGSLKRTLTGHSYSVFTLDFDIRILALCFHR
jgi:WD40 repeat protein